MLVLTSLLPKWAFVICLKAAISTPENFPQKENFVKCDLADTNFPSEENFEVENFQLLTMIFSQNFLSVEIFLAWKWGLILNLTLIGL